MLIGYVGRVLEERILKFYKSVMFTVYFRDGAPWIKLNFGLSLRTNIYILSKKPATVTVYLNINLLLRKWRPSFMDSKSNPPKKIKTDKKSSNTPPTSTNKNKTVLIVVGIVAVLLIGGVVMNSNRGRLADTVSKIAEEKVINSFSDGKTKISSNGNSLTVKSKDGVTSTYTQSKSISADFPSDIPLYENQEIIGIAKSITVKGTSWILSTNSNDATEAVNNFFKDKLTSTGWTNETEFNVNKTFSAGYSKGNLKFSYSTTENFRKNFKTGITYTVLRKK